MDVKIDPSWKNKLQEEFNKPYFIDLIKFVKQEYSQQTIYPPGKFIFNAFDQTPFEEVKVVILGQDPYHGPNQAHGLSFSVQDGQPFPPSLLNIFKEIKSQTGAETPKSGNLERWAKQGVLLLNATLTVRAHQAGSHQKKGWEEFTDAVIQLIANQSEQVVFLLWGAYAGKKAQFINPEKHLILKSAHPSPLAAHRGFFGNNHFVEANAYLEAHGKSPIDW